jgi:dipeptidyl aminopeptidase/acylaminoacyl peptidase
MASAKTLTPEQVAKVPQPGYIQPVNITFSPDDALITFLLSPDRSRTLQLYAFDPQTGERGLFLEPPGAGTTDENVSLEEALRRERTRQWGMGVTDYGWAEAGRRLLVPLPDGVYVQDASGLRKIIESGVQDARFSPDGTRLACVRDDDLWVVDVDVDGDDGGEPRALTTGAAAAGVTRGLAEYIAAEEMGRHEGFWWSPDGTRIAFTEVDERRIPVYRIMHQGKDALGAETPGGGPPHEDHRYPFAGQENAIVRLAVVEVATGELTWMNISVGGPGATYEYLARVKWLPSGQLVAVAQDRRQRQLDLIRFDTLTGVGSPFLHEAVRDWVNLHDIFHPLPAEHSHAPGGFVWASERTGFRHLFLHDKNGRPMRQLTDGEWLVDTLAGALRPRPVPDRRRRVRRAARPARADAWRRGAVDMRAQYLRSPRLPRLHARQPRQPGAGWRSRARSRGTWAGGGGGPGGRRALAGGAGAGRPGRVGMYGWSYGGYMAPCASPARPRRSPAAWRARRSPTGTATTRTTPSATWACRREPRGLPRSSVMAHVGNMRGRLMLVHGLIDENVHFRHTARLINALIATASRTTCCSSPTSAICRDGRRTGCSWRSGCGTSS